MTFSPKPSPACSDPLATAALLDACASVAEECLYSITDPCDRDAFAAWTPPDADGWLRATVAFTGLTAGTLAVTVRRASAREWCAGFAGLGPDDPLPEAQVQDFATEVANMICGAWLTRRSAHELFSLAPRGVDVIDDGAAADAATGEAHMEYLFVNDAPVCLTLSLGAAPVRS